MKYMAIVGVIIFSLAFSCEGDEDRFVDCSTVLCQANEFIMRYEDHAGNPLIGTLFLQDSFKLQSATTTLYIKPKPFGTPEHLIVPFESIHSDEEYTLRLSENESDTFRFIFNSQEGSCCTDSNFDEFRYNGTIIESSSRNFYILIR